MPDDFSTLANPLLNKAGIISERPVPDAGNAFIPAGIEVISADDHWGITEDIFYHNFPAHLKERAPRIWFDRYWRIGRKDGNQTYVGKNAENLVLAANLHTAWNHDVRRPHLAAEGVQKEIVFPQLLLGYFDPDPEIREWIFRVYNEYITRQNKLNPTFFGLGVFSNWWDPAKVEAAMDQIVKLGLKGFLLPLKFMNGENKELSYADPSLAHFWNVVAEAKLPVCYHVGESFNFEGPGAVATGFLMGIAPFRRPISQLIFGGVFDRHPDLQVVFAEGGLGWVLPWLQDAEALYDTYGAVIEPPEHRPSYYWRNNCSATFQADALGLSHLDVLGADRVMWASDYPHTEGTFGFSGTIMKAIIEQVGEADAKLILGGNAKRVFRL